MAIPEEIQLQHDILNDAILNSSLSNNLKEDLIKLAHEAKLNTNGRTYEEKVQKLSENNYHLITVLTYTLINISNNMKEKKKANLFDMIIAIKNQIMIIAITAIICSIFNPEITLMIEHLFGK